MKPEIQILPVSSVVNKFDVRKELDQDRVIQFAEMYEAGVNLPPIEVVRLSDDKYAYIDGRHRGAALAFLDRTEMQAIVRNGSLSSDPVELYARALSANWGGAKPPSRDDITHTIVRMLESGATQSTVREKLAFLPVGALRAHIATARSAIMKRKIGRALDCISHDGLNIEAAAKRCALSVDVLKCAVEGKKSKWGAGRSDAEEFSIGVKQYISRELRSANSGISKKVTELFRKLEDGELSSDHVASVLQAWGDHLRHTSVRIKDWRERLDAITSSQENAVKVAEN